MTTASFTKEEIISRLREDVLANRLDRMRDQHQISRLKQQIKNLKALLPCCVDEETGVVDKEKEKHYWQEIRAADKQLSELRNKRVANSAVSAAPNYTRLREFLKNLPERWAEYSGSSRNRFLKALVDRVELKGDNDIQATICWKAGFKQEVTIHRDHSRKLADRLWTMAEDRILRQLFPTAPRETVVGAFPGRSWKSITLRATRLRLKRKRGQPARTDKKPESKHDGSLPAAHLREPLKVLPAVVSGSRHVTWDAQNLDLPQKASSGRLRGIFYFPPKYCSASLTFSSRLSFLETGRVTTARLASATE